MFALGDFTVNTVLTSLAILYVTHFLLVVAGLRPELAGAVQLIGRTIDAFADPAMGRISDRCRWRWGRRRPFFLLGAIPFGAGFGLLWAHLPEASQLAMFAYYTTVFVLMSLSMTVLAVPYLALQPEMALGYDARTSLNAWRNAGSILGVFAAIAVRPVANAFGGGPEGFTAAGALYGAIVAAPWAAIYAVTWERPEFQARESAMPFFAGVRLAARHANFRRLVGLFLCGRVAMDLVGAMLILYFTLWLRRSGDFEPTMALFFAIVLASLPFWVRLAERAEKATVFRIGALWWAAALAVIVFVRPDWPRWLVIGIAASGAIGYAVMDLMPWSMLGEVVDEDDLETGERREGTYYGLFMFVRKLAGTLAVWLALTLLGALGYRADQPPNEATLTAARWLTSVVPAAFLVLAAWLARGYRVTRARHAEIRAALERRPG
ncbi:MAG TPA: MFS transporter [Myxococcota bacterium]|nr:MFS transporter [Myxococcota bacterium]